MSVSHTLATLADMLEASDHASAFAAHSWTWGALSIHGRRTVSAPAVEAIEKAHPEWREWTREEAITHLRALAGTPEVENAALAAAHAELEDTRQALGQALGIHPAAHYSLAEMVAEVAERVTPREPWTPDQGRGIPVHRRPESTIVDVPLPDMPQPTT